MLFYGKNIGLFVLMFEKQSFLFFWAITTNDHEDISGDHKKIISDHEGIANDHEGITSDH
jgi:nitrogen fixation-related uncharacterized protein